MIHLLAQVSKDNVNGMPQVEANSSSIESALAVLFGTFAAIAVLVIVISAINFARAGGNPEKISQAKNTIIYAVIGLVISVSAEIVVFTVLRRLNG